MHTRVAAVQFGATPFNLQRNLETAERLVRQAAAGGARLVVLPELFGTGYVFARRLAGLAEDRHGPTLTLLGRLSAELGVHVAGSLLLREAGRVHSTLALAEPGGRLHCYARQHLFAWERSFCEPGRGPLVAETELGRLGLLAGWDIGHPAAWRAYAGKVDGMLVASAQPRLHRAVLNFPRGQKVYLAQLMPELLRRRDEIDGWYSEHLGARAAWLGVPLVHAVMAGRFVSEPPFARLSFAAAALARPRYWPLIFQAHLATVRATFYASSAVYDGHGRVLAQAGADEGLALSGIELGGPRPAAPAARPAHGLRLPLQLRLLDRLLRPLMAAQKRAG